MDLTQTKPIILSVGTSQWFAKGVERLERSLNFVGSPIPWKTWKDEYPPGSPSHEQFPYAFKISAIDWAIAQGYTHVLWCDASFWAVKSPMPIFDIINEFGFYAFLTGYNVAQTATDRVLSATGVTRDEAEKASEFAGGFVGFNLENPNGKALYELWKSYMDAGLSRGSRNHDDQSKDPRFLFSRNDQTLLSLAMHKLHLRNTLGLDHIAYFGPNHSPEDVIFFLQGIS